MADNIDDIIKSLNILKSQASKNNNSAELVNAFKKYKQSNESLTQKIIDNLKGIEGDINQIEMAKREFFEQIDNMVDPSNIKKPKNKRVKKFYKQESVLTNLMNSQNYLTIYNVFFAFLVILIPNFIINEYVSSSFKDSLNVIYTLLSGVTQVFTGTIKLFLATIIYVIIFRFVRVFFKSPIFLIMITLGFIVLMAKFFYSWEEQMQLSMVCRIMYYTEVIRSILKIWAYFAEKGLFLSYYNSINDLSETIVTHKTENSNDKPINSFYIVLKDNGEKLEIVLSSKMTPIKDEIMKMAYFYFIPTLIFRDEYPTENKINYKEASLHLLNFFLAMIFLFLIFKLYLIRYFSDSIDFLEKDNFIKVLVNFILLSIMVMFVLFFGFFHSFLNFSAELLQFPDRFFYKPFWSSRNPVNFYRYLTFNFEEFFLYNVKYYLDGIVGNRLAEFARIFFFIAGFEFIFYNSLNYLTAVVPVTIWFSHIFTLPLGNLKSQRLILFTWLAVSLGLGFFCLIMISDFYFFQHFGEKDKGFTSGGFWIRFINYYLYNQTFDS